MIVRIKPSTASVTCQIADPSMATAKLERIGNRSAAALTANIPEVNSSDAMSTTPMVAIIETVSNRPCQNARGCVPQPKPRTG